MHHFTEVGGWELVAQHGQQVLEVVVVWHVERHAPRADDRY